MDKKTLNEELRKMIQEIIGPPKDKQKESGPLIVKTKKQHEDIKEEDDIITKSLTDLLIYIKYLLFDLEATRRERDSLKKKLDDK